MIKDVGHVTSDAVMVAPYVSRGVTDGDGGTYCAVCAARGAAE
jgi:hypothetical protein